MDKTKYFIMLDLNKISDYCDDNCKILLQFKEFEATLETRLENTFVFELSDFSKIIIPYNWVLFMFPINSNYNKENGKK